MREEVKWFAEQMEGILQQNDYKRGWKGCSMEYLYYRLVGEVGELFNKLAFKEEYKNPELLRETIDIANFAMMIATKLKGL